MTSPNETQLRNPRAAHGYRGRSCSITAVGSYVPERVLTNADLERMVNTTDEWITTRTGIKERRLAGPEEFTWDLATKAAQRALERANVAPERIDLIIVATITPDMPFPSTACLVQQKLGAQRAAAFDIEAACSGFIYALEIGQQFITSRTYYTVLVAFIIATDAIAAALSAQQALLAETWAWIQPHTLRVRIAIHTGTAERPAGDYFGPVLNRLARLMSVGHGRQVLISAATAELVSEDLPDGARLLDLGNHRLKDLTRPEHVFQLLHPSLPSDFPLLKSLDAYPNNLAIQLTSFIGRQQEIAEIANLLSKSRLVSLTGPGGTGKTRLSQEVG